MEEDILNYLPTVMLRGTPEFRCFVNIIELEKKLKRSKNPLRSFTVLCTLQNHVSYFLGRRFCAWVKPWLVGYEGGGSKELGLQGGGAWANYAESGGCKTQSKHNLAECIHL